MSDEMNSQADGESSAIGERMQVNLRYKGTSQVVDEGDGARVALFSNTYRSPVRAQGVLKDPIRVREALSVLYEVVKSDFRYVPKDRTAYLAYQRMSNKSSSSSNSFDAQRQHFEWLAQNDPNAWLILDPTITVHPDELIMEVFSKDEGSYARLGIDWSAFDIEGEMSYGTTNIDYSKELFSGVQRMRSYRQTRLSLGTDQVALETDGEQDALEKQINIPTSWMRGFLQVQSSATLPHSSFTMAPIDLYNLLRHLRLHADTKKGGRAIRVELIPGEYPRMVLEPWELVLPTSAKRYEGQVAQVVRIWGRRRLMLLRRLLPFIDSVDVHLLGTGLPNFYVMRCGPVSFTMGLTGFTSSNWSQALNLDSLLPRTASAGENLSRVLEHLKTKWSASVDELERALGMDRASLRHALQVGCQNGQLMYEMGKELYRLRPVSDHIDLEKLEFRNERERQGYDLLNNKGGYIKIESENHLVGVGIQYVGLVQVDADRREYRCEMTIDDEGRVKRVDDTSPFFRKHQLKEGPSAPLIALRLKVAAEQQRRATERGSDKITYETRTYVRRHDGVEDVYQLSLEQNHLKVQWGKRSMAKLRSQNLLFNSVDDARKAYFNRIRGLERKGFMDATAN